jgi:hypothetical protein
MNILLKARLLALFAYLHLHIIKNCATHFTNDNRLKKLIIIGGRVANKFNPARRTESQRLVPAVECTGKRLV